MYLSETVFYMKYFSKFIIMYYVYIYKSFNIPLSSKIDNIYMYMPIILKSMSLYAISSQPLWFTVGDIICLCVAFSAFNQAVNFCSYQAPPPPPTNLHTQTYLHSTLSRPPPHTCHTHLHPTPAQQTLNTQTTLREIIRCVVQGH